MDIDRQDEQSHASIKPEGSVPRPCEESFEPDSIYTAFLCAPKASSTPAGGGGSSLLMLLLPLVAVVTLQLALLCFVAVAFSDMMHKTMEYSMAAYPALGQHCQAKEAWAFLLLALVKICALCALALYTHAEVQAAVDLCDRLTAALAADVPAISCARLAVPCVQLVVAGVTLLIQGLLFQTYTIPLDQDSQETQRFAKINEAVFACVTLAFICELDNRVWGFVKPLIGPVAAVGGGCTQPAGSHASLLLLLAQGLQCSSAGRRGMKPHGSGRSSQHLWPKPCSCHRLPRRSGRVCCSGCKLFWSGCFHVLLFVYECMFGMLLLMYADDYALTRCPGQLALALLLGLGCFVVFQVVAGVRSGPISTAAGPQCGCRKQPAWLRPVVLNLLCPLVVGSAVLGIYAALDGAVADSEWRCKAGAVINCGGCKDDTNWCSSTLKCATECKGQGGGPSAECMAGWCSNISCIICLLHHNSSSMPMVNRDYDLAGSDLLMCGRMQTFAGCVVVWTAFVPVACTVLLAVLFLVCEGTRRCQCRLCAHTSEAKMAVAA